MNTPILYLTLFQILVFSMNAQKRDVKDNIYLNVPRTQKVHSFNGLNLRDAPNTDGNIIAKLPFGSEVEVLEFAVGKAKSRTPENYEAIRNGDNWARVKWKDKLGYVVDWAISGHIGRDGYSYYSSYYKRVNIDYLFFWLGPVGGECWYNFWFQPDLYWYSYQYKNDTLISERIDPYDIYTYNAQILGPNDFGGYYLGVPNKQLEFVIASKSLLNTGVISGLRKYPINVFDIESDFPEYMKEENDLGLCIEGIFHPLGSEIQEIYQVLFIGDLDGDDVDDYIIHFDEKSSIVLMFLSTAAEKDQIVKPVAAYYTGYCC